MVRVPYEESNGLGFGPSCVPHWSCDLRQVTEPLLVSFLKQEIRKWGQMAPRPLAALTFTDQLRLRSPPLALQGIK